ncbi:L-lactate dehydrogenase [Beutenbergia cavernae DSM 12333]|uniref:L-lactate dehydrogenase n=1 Tax=Beutenbergia cavernae (strain ATCC BAA-8 / DSM 12333 / CCUG 43141 / JCM 11478 / NBRC 16432 / NCIMB 13614 / HKI 0122) TaxID=471853 RepID=C5BWL8_BEUC1|nr:L-lactate dehydrogenase [Beutenbergia cavernae]ACQ80684.1 L-lactate dehydrogenase [Beutenbergia cavernae DSM 12333]
MSADPTPSSSRSVSTLAVVGAGSVGATLAYAALMRGAARHVVLYDINRKKVEAEALDIGHGIEFMPQGTIEGSDDLEICRGADVVVFTAGAKQHPGQSRMDLAERTVGLVREVMPRLVAMTPDAIHVMVTNPVDVVTYAAQAVTGLPTQQLFGSGTVLDSSRMRYLVAQECGVAVQNVHAYILGEHGDSEIPIWSSASIGGVPLLEWPGHGRQPLFDVGVRERITHEVITSAYRIIEGKGATNYAVALAATRIIEAILRGEHRVLPVSTRIDDYVGISDVCMSVPTVVDRGGAVQRLLVPMDDAEIAGLRASADHIRSVARSLGF